MRTLTSSHHPRQPLAGLTVIWISWFVASAADVGRLVILDARTGKPRIEVRSPIAAYSPATYSPTGHQILAASPQQELLVLDANTGDVMRRLPTNNTATAGPLTVMASWASHGGEILELRRSLTDPKLRPGTAFVRDAKSGEVKFTLEDADHGIGNAIFSPDGKSIITTGQEHASLTWWEASTGQRTRVLVEMWSGNGVVRGVTLAENGRIGRWWNPDLAAPMDAGSVKIEHLHEGYSDQSLLVPGGAMLMTLGSGGWIRMWDIATAQVLWTSSHATINSETWFSDRRPGNFLFSPDGSRFLHLAEKPRWRNTRTCRVQPAALRFEETQMQLKMLGNQRNSEGTNAPPRSHRLVGESTRIGVSSGVFSPDGSQLFTWGPPWAKASRDRRLLPRLWDFQTGHTLWAGQITGVLNASFAPDGNTIAVVVQPGAAAAQP